MEEDDGSPTQDDGKRPGLGSLSSVLPRAQRGPWREWVAPLSLVPRGKVTFLMGWGVRVPRCPPGSGGGAAEDGSPFRWDTSRSFSDGSHPPPSCSGSQPSPPELSAPRVQQQQQRHCLLPWEKGLSLGVWFCWNEGGGCRYGDRDPRSQGCGAGGSAAAGMVSSSLQDTLHGVVWFLMPTGGVTCREGGGERGWGWA